MTNRDIEDDELWRKSVGAISTFSYVNAGLRNAIPRLAHLAPALDELTEVVSALPCRPLVRVMAVEVGNLRERLSLVADSLNASLARMADFMKEIEERDRQPED
jgi:hypothetical protein